MLHLSSSSASSALSSSAPGTSPDGSFLWPPLTRSRNGYHNEKEQECKLEFSEQEEWDCMAELLRKTGDEGSPDKQAKARAASHSEAWLRSSPQSILARDACWGTNWNRVGDNSSSSSSFPSPPHSPCLETPHLDEGALEALYIELIRLRVEEEIRLRAVVEVSLRAEQHHRLLLSAKQMLTNAQSENLGSSLHTAAKRGAPPRSGCAETCVSTTELGLDEKSYLFRQQTQASLHTTIQHQKLSTGALLEALYQHPNMNTAKAKGNTFYPRHTHSSTTSRYGTKKSQSGTFDGFLNAQGCESGGGTGVFIPRRTDEVDFKKKPVLLPTHIVQAFNSNVGETISSPVSDSLVSTSHNREMMYERSNNKDTRWTLGHSQLQEVSPGVTLPKDWTY